VRKLSYLFTQKIKQITTSLLIIFLVYFSVFSFHKSNVSEFFELYIYDKLLQRYSAVSTTPPVTTIIITENDINQLNSWPVSDKLLAEILTQLIQYKARVIGIDIYRDTPVPPGHKKLDSLFRQHQNIIASMKFSDKQATRVNPPSALLKTEQFGFIDALPDRDGVVRRGLLFLDDGKEVFYSFPLRIALMYLQTEGIVPQSNTTNLRLKSTSIAPFKTNDGGYVNADAKGYQFLLDFCKPTESIPRYTLEQFRQGNIKLENFKDRIVLLGVVAESVKDFYYTSCNRGTEHNEQVSGVLMHAAIVDQILRIAQEGQTPIKTATNWQEMLWIFLWTVSGVLISQRQYSLGYLIVVWTTGIGVLLSSTVLLFASGVWLIVATPALAWFLSSILTIAHNATQEKLKRSQLMSLFSKHVAPEIAADIWKKHELFFAEGRPRPQQTTATIMFTDLQHFTALAENLEPEALFDWLNEYLVGMTPIVANHGGIVIRFIGDAIFAGFGIPVPRTSTTQIRQDAINAVNCALAMNEKLIQLNKQWRQQGLPVVGMRIGLYTGQIATGSIGDKNRMEYTIHGDTVNTAARLEGFYKSQFKPDYFQRPCRILIGGKMLDYVENLFQIETVRTVELRGKKDIVEIYQVIGKNKSKRI
jgi:adenylate cyclase